MALAFAWTLGTDSVLGQIEDPGPENVTGRLSLTSPPGGLSLVGPVSLPLIAEVGDVSVGDVSVEFFNGETSLGIVDSPFGVLPPGGDEGELSANGLYPFTFDSVSAGDYAFSAVLWIDGLEVARTEMVGLTVLAVERQVEVNVSVSDPSGAEGGATGEDWAEVRVERTGSLAAPLEVFFEWDGAAEFGVDFVAQSGSVIIPAGDSSTVLGLQPIDDALVEGDEVVVMRLLPAVCPDDVPPSEDCYLIGQDGVAELTLRDNDSAPTNEPPVVVLVTPFEGQTFRAGEAIELVAHGWDFDGALASVEFLDGEVVLGSVAVEAPAAPIDTNLPVPPTRSIVSFLWEQADEGRHALRVVGVDDEGDRSVSPTVVIGVVGSEALPVVSIEAVDAEATEDGGRGRPDETNGGTIVVSRTGSLARALVVSLDVGGSATAGEDYGQVRDQVTIPARQSRVAIPLVPRNDDEVEGTETVVVALLPSDCNQERPGNPRCYIVGRASRARVEILDDDKSEDRLAPRIALVRPRSGSEYTSDQTIPLIAEAHDRDGRVVSVAFFANGEQLGEVRQRGQGNSRFFRFSLERPEPGPYEWVAVATDNDGITTRSAPLRVTVKQNLVRALVSVRASDPVAAETRAPDRDGEPRPNAPSRANTATFLVSRSGLLDVPLSIMYELAGGGENGTDYDRLSGVLELAAGQRSARIVVVPIDDELVEGAERVRLTVLPPVCIEIFPPPADCYVVGRQNSADIVIRDNENPVNERPRIVIAARDTENLLAPAAVALEARTVDSDGFVRSVTFFANGRPIATVRGAGAVPPGTEQSFNLAWSDVGPGRYEVVAVAEDNMGGESRSPELRIVVLETLIEGTIVSVEAIDPVATEGLARDEDSVDVGLIRFTRDGDLSVPVPVRYRLGGSAVNGRDYGDIERSFVFSPGEASVDLVVEPIDDDQVEGSETVTVALLRPICVAIFPPPPECYQLGDQAVATVTIFDNDRSRNLLPRVVIVSPRQEAVLDPRAEITVRVEAVDRDGWVGYAALFAGDQRVAEQRLTFIREPDPGEGQRFDLVWSEAPAGKHALRAVVRDDQGGESRSRVVNVVVARETDLPVVTAFVRDGFASEPEGNRPPNKGSIRVRRSGSTEEALEVHYDVRGTAENGTDYERLEGSVVIPERKRWTTIEVVPLADADDEPFESVVLRLVGVGPAGLRGGYEVGRAAQAGVVIGSRGLARGGVRRLEDGTVHVDIPAPNGRSFRIESSTRLGDWEVVGTNTATEDAIHIVDTESAGTEAKFFRIVSDEDSDGNESDE